MNILDALTLTNKIFVYTSDKSYYIFPEVWRVVGRDGKGDCEDYSLTAVWYYSDGNWLRWLWNINFGPFRFWHCRAPSRDGHLVTQITRGEHKGMWFDNIQKKLVTRDTLEAQGYTLKFWWPFPMSMLRVAVGYTFGTVGRLLRKILD
jgi:hypothetical protein